MMRCIAKALLSTPDLPRPHVGKTPPTAHFCSIAYVATLLVKHNKKKAEEKNENGGECGGDFHPLILMKTTSSYSSLAFAAFFKGKCTKGWERRNSGGLATAEDMQMVYILSKHKDYVWQGI